jgi:hypothetical protein
MRESEWQAVTYKVSWCAAASISLQVLRFRSASAAAEMPSFLLGEAARKSAVSNQLSAIAIYRSKRKNRKRRWDYDVLQKHALSAYLSNSCSQYGCWSVHKAHEGQGQEEGEGAQGEQKEAERWQARETAASATSGTLHDASIGVLISMMTAQYQ